MPQDEVLEDFLFALMIDPIIARMPPGELRDYYIWLRNPLQARNGAVELARKDRPAGNLFPEGLSP